jgi:predicted RNA-binding protein with PUA domain
VRDACSEHVVERRNAVGGDEQETVIVEAVHVAHLPAGVKLEVWKIGLQENGVEKLRCHKRILQVENDAYSSVPEIFVNDFRHTKL